eukprot:CAMPEP_0119309012 /NCGR_PEP_ID=MMETSP1333-20130426/13601_1 /TAXON_ID=418940 /ORGANISM="Scyphosphaera apsteinii, Strain RCC1455" /LENGTH=59 /DNA_ID=CAMNT_0007312913 /DNA_START=70 /DNA_END=246 /DNA_ORIENTATION=+
MAMGRRARLRLGPRVEKETGVVVRDSERLFYALVPVWKYKYTGGAFKELVPQKSFHTLK